MPPASAKMIRHYEQIGLLPGARAHVGLPPVSRARRVGAASSGSRGAWASRWNRCRAAAAVEQQGPPPREVQNARAGTPPRARGRCAKLPDAGGTQGLVHACHGGDKPDCAILRHLAIASPEAPEPRAVSVHPVRKAKGAHRGERAIQWHRPATPT